MNSTEKIIGIITEEAETYASKVIKTAQERAEAIIADARIKAEKITASFAEKAERESSDILKRASSSADILERNILLDAKSVIIDGVYREAEKSFSETDGERYFAFLEKALNSAVVFLACSEQTDDGEEEETSDLYVVSLNERDKLKFGNKLISSVRDTVDGLEKKITLCEKPGSFSGGLKVSLGNVETSSTVETLIMTSREKTESHVYGILFR